MEMLSIVESEAERAVEKAFAEGYKRGLLAGVPEAEYWKARCSALETELLKANRQKWLFAFGGFSLGLASGCGAGLSIRIH